VRTKERIQAGLFLVLAERIEGSPGPYLRYNNAGCAARNMCMTAIVVASPATYAASEAMKYGFEKGPVTAARFLVCRKWS
jgi:hypothetical protein